MYDVGMSVFTGDLPTNLTRNGMSYPSCLLGISGAFSSLSKDIYRLSVGSSSASPTPQDLFKVCVPRAVITTTCSPSLGDGFTANVVQQQLQIRQPRYITEFTLLNNGQTVDYNTFPGKGSLAYCLLSTRLTRPLPRCRLWRWVDRVSRILVVP